MPTPAETGLETTRRFAKSPEGKGIRIGCLIPSDLENPGFEVYKQMAQDIQSWFDPKQGWHLSEITTGFINLKRMEESSAQGKIARIKAKKDQPDQFTLTFHFDSENPPITGKILGPKKLNLYRAMLGGSLYDGVAVHFDLAGRYELESATVFPTHIGPVYQLDKAVDKMSSPYFLKGGVRVNANRRAKEDESLWLEIKNNPKNSEPATSLSVFVIMQDLGDYLQIQKKKAEENVKRFNEAFNGKGKMSETKPQETVFEAPSNIPRSK